MLCNIQAVYFKLASKIYRGATAPSSPASDAYANYLVWYVPELKIIFLDSWQMANHSEVWLAIWQLWLAIMLTGTCSTINFNA